jgi:hypothetical protein
VAHDVVIAANAGIRLHGAEVVIGNRLIGDELFAAAGVAVPLPVGPLRGLEDVRLTGELSGALGDRVRGLSGPSPAEARIGALVKVLPALTVGAHLGVGLDDQIGAPQFRAVLELAWTPIVAHRPGPPPAPEESDESSDEPDATP